MQVSFSAVVERTVAYSEPSNSIVVVPAKASFPFLVEYVVVPDKAITDEESLSPLDLADYIVGDRFCPTHISPIDALTGNYKPFRQFFLQHGWQPNRNRGNYFWSAVKASNFRWRFSMVATISDYPGRDRVGEVLWFWLNINEYIGAFCNIERCGSCQGGISGRRGGLPLPSGSPPQETGETSHNHGSKGINGSTPFFDGLIIGRFVIALCGVMLCGCGR
jgi:hypothetical protein